MKFCTDMYLHNRPTPRELQGHRSKVKVTLVLGCFSLCVDADRPRQPAGSTQPWSRLHDFVVYFASTTVCWVRCGSSGGAGLCDELDTRCSDVFTRSSLWRQQFCLRNRLLRQYNHVHNHVHLIHRGRAKMTTNNNQFNHCRYHTESWNFSSKMPIEVICRDWLPNELLKHFALSTNGHVSSAST